MQDETMVKKMQYLLGLKTDEKTSLKERKIKETDLSIEEE